MTERRRHRKADVRERLIFLFGFVLIAIAFWVLHTQQGHLSSQERSLLRQEREIRGDAITLGEQHTSLVEACVRLQIVRVEDNLSHYADFKVFRVVLRLSRLARQRHLSPARVQRQREFLGALAAAIRAKAWVPVTNCARAVSLHGARYRPPKPVPFYRELPPPSALHLSQAHFG